MSGSLAILLIGHSIVELSHLPNFVSLFPWKLKQCLHLMGIFRMDKVHHPRQSVPMGGQRPFQGNRGRGNREQPMLLRREATLLPGDHFPLPASSLASSPGTKTLTYQGSDFWGHVGDISWLKCNFETSCVWSLFTMVADWEVLAVFALSLWKPRPFK